MTHFFPIDSSSCYKRVYKDCKGWNMLQNLGCADLQCQPALGDPPKKMIVNSYEKQSTSS
jgi:hypothetical protein